MDNRVSVKVMLNQDSNFLSGYQPGDRLFEAAAFEMDYPPEGAIETLLDVVFEQLNIDMPRADWAIEYRVSRNRSLSCGDVVCLGEVAFTCAMVGWDRVTVVPK